MDYFSYYVAPIWYRLYYGVMMTFASVVFVGSVLAHALPAFHHVGGTLGLSYTALMLAAVVLIYNLTGFRAVMKRSPTLAVMLAAMLLAFVNLNGAMSTDPHVGAWLYVGMWLVTALFAGIYGLPILLGTILIVEIYVLMECQFQLAHISHVSLFLSLSDPLLALGAYLTFWRHIYIEEERKQVSRLSGMLRSNQQQSEILINSIADAVIIITNEGKIGLMNPAAAAMTEWPIDEATDVDIEMVAKVAHENGTAIPDDENPFRVALQHKEHINQTITLTGRNGRKQIVSLVISSIIPQEGGEPTGAVAVMRDVSDEHAAEQQRADFISTAAHEMRTPVAAIEGYLSLALNEKVSNVDSRARAYLEKAHTSTQHLGKLFQDLLTSSKAEDGRLSNHPQVVEMGAFMQQLADDLKFAAEKKGLFAEFVIGATDTIDATAKDAAAQHVVKPLYYVQVDPDRMREVITNLFDNACKYTEQGKISIGLTGNNDVVQLYVRDTGAGIPADDIPHLFQKFYRVDNSATRVIGGTGLGLFICRKIVELYNGRIWVESQLGQGSTFFINLPRLTTQHAQQLQTAEAATAAQTPPPMSTGTAHP